MKLPCERYLLLLFLKGMTQKYVLRVLAQLGYVETDPSEALERYVKDLYVRVQQPLTNDRTVSNFVANNLLSRVWHDDAMCGTVRAVVDSGELRFAVESLLAADGNHQLVSNAVMELHRKVIPESVIRMYSHLVWDLKSLSRWELDMLFELHRAGTTYRVLYSMGHQVALLYSGAVVDIDKEEELKFMRAAAAAKYREAVVTRDAIAGSAAAKRWMHIFTAANEQLGPMDVIRKLIARVQLVKPTRERIEAVPYTELESISGLTRGIAMLADITEAQRAKEDAESSP